MLGLVVIAMNAITLNEQSSFCSLIGNCSTFIEYCCMCRIETSIRPRLVLRRMLLSSMPNGKSILPTALANGSGFLLPIAVSRIEMEKSFLGSNCCSSSWFVPIDEYPGRWTPRMDHTMRESLAEYAPVQI